MVSYEVSLLRCSYLGIPFRLSRLPLSNKLEENVFLELCGGENLTTVFHEMGLFLGKDAYSVLVCAELDFQLRPFFV